MRSLCIFSLGQDFLLVASHAYDTRWDTNGKGSLGHIMRNHGACSNHGMLSNVDSRQNNRTHPDPSMVLDDYGTLCHQRLIEVRYPRCGTMIERVQEAICPQSPVAANPNRRHIGNHVYTTVDARICADRNLTPTTRLKVAVAPQIRPITDLYRPAPLCLNNHYAIAYKNVGPES